MTNNLFELVELFANYLGWSIIALALYFLLSSALGLIRFPDFYAKMHAVSVADSIGIPLFFLGLIFIQPQFVFSLRSLIIIVLFLILAPTSAHALIKAAWHRSENKENSK